MAVDSSSGSVITITEAQKYVSAFRVKFPSEIKGVFAGKDQINKILQQTDCIGIRMYYGIDDDSKMNLVLVGVDKYQKDMTDGVILDRLSPCPHECDTTSALY